MHLFERGERKIERERESFSKKEILSTKNGFNPDLWQNEGII